VRFGVDCSQHQQTWSSLLSRVQFAEEAGFDGAWVFDHFKPLYGSPDGPCLEGWTLLAALAALTSTIRLGTLVTGVTYRHPSVLAASALTVDHVSSGRLELGIGAAWFDQEHRELGIGFPPTGERARRLEEAVQVVKLLCVGDPVSYDGRYYTLDGGSLHPRPVQRPHPPVWIGASGRKLTLPIVGREADVWHTFGSADDIRSMRAIVDSAAHAVDRDPSTIATASMLSISEPWDVVRRNAESMASAGVSYLAISWPADGQPRVEDFVSSVLPDLAGL
jgi:F420-dependent oxidoreductase-like protein